MPIWLLTYTYGHKSYQVVANGVTGNMAGESAVELDQDHPARHRRLILLHLWAPVEVKPREKPDHV